jgi:hypothetical protein
MLSVWGCGGCLLSCCSQVMILITRSKMIVHNLLFVCKEEHCVSPMITKTLNLWLLYFAWFLNYCGINESNRTNINLHVILWTFWYATFKKLSMEFNKNTKDEIYPSQHIASHPKYTHRWKQCAIFVRNI